MSGSNGGETQQANTVCISGERLSSVCFYSLNVKVGTEEKPLTYLKERKKIAYSQIKYFMFGN